MGGNKNLLELQPQWIIPTKIFFHGYAHVLGFGNTAFYHNILTFIKLVCKSNNSIRKKYKTVQALEKGAKEEGKSPIWGILVNFYILTCIEYNF